MPLGVAGGLVLGSSLKHSLGLSKIGHIQNSSSNQTESEFISWIILGRFISGAIAVQSARFLGKKFLYKVIYACSSLKTSENLKDYIKNSFYLDLNFYFFCYTIVSFSAVLPSFLVFEFFNIM